MNVAKHGNQKKKPKIWFKLFCARIASTLKSKTIGWITVVFQFLRQAIARPVTSGQTGARQNRMVIVLWQNVEIKRR